FDTNAGSGNTVRITREMYRDLETTDLFRLFSPKGTKVMMAHGAKDAVIDPEAAKRFAEIFDIPLVVFENEGHTLGESPETPERVVDLAISFFNEEAEDSDNY
ncbi:MAG: alpha/beta hydrolase, partial [Oscillospiraceae bacterium]|nr:alpha/beta hydrolase [Oscillospiraceae bacterium]